jgi:DNA modification methylase
VSDTPKWEVIHGDCLEIMRQLPDGCVDAVVTDPPYGISHSTNHGASWAGTTIANDHDTSARDLVIAWASERNMPWCAFGSWKRNPPDGTRGVLVWDKGPAFGMGDLSFPWKMSWEEIYVGGDGWTGRRDEGVLRGHIVPSWESAGRVHPHQKPVSLIRYLVSRLHGSATILDPFCGSGSTGVAAVQLGLSFIGIEREAAYVDIARRRIADAAAQTRLAL